MRKRRSYDAWAGEETLAGQAGVTLLEVLAAIFVMGVGLLSLLTLFPLGAMEMAQAIKDDRTAAVSASAAAFSEAGRDLLTRTTEFALVSLSKGVADPQVVAQLREEYEDFAVWAAELEAELEALKSVYPRRVIQPHLGPLLARMRSIKLRVDVLVRLLSLVENEAR